MVVIVVEEQKISNGLCDAQGNSLAIDDLQEILSQNTQLIQMAIDGDKAAFSQLYMQSYRYVFFAVKNYISDDETTYDAIQETFIKVFQGISKLRSPDAYYGWLTTIAKNTAKNILRSKRDETPINEDEDYSSFLKQDQTKKDVELDIKKILKELQPQDAELLSLVYYDGMRVTQIAKMQGVPAATVYTRLNRAKRNLKAQLAVHGIDKAIYSGDFVAMTTTAIRNMIGTSLLSVVIAQQILNNVLNGKDKKEIAVAKVIKQQQKKQILKIASCIVAISIIASIITGIVFHCFIGDETSNNESAISTSDNISSSSKETNNDTSQSDKINTDANNNTHGSSFTDDFSQPDFEIQPPIDDTQDSNSSIISNSSNDSVINSSTVSSDISSNTASNIESSNNSQEPTQYATATYVYRDATANDCYTAGNIPAYPIEDVIVIIGVKTAASDGVYTIPETIDGKKVGAIMPSAFCDSNISGTVKKVIVPASVKTIWQNAFSNCYNLTDIYLSGKIIDIFTTAFADVSMRVSQLTIHCAYDCKNFSYYYYRNIAKDYDAIYQEWDGSTIQ